MNINSARRRLADILLLAAMALFVSKLPAQAPETPEGDLWESVSQTMDGMPIAMPPQDMQICAAKEWTRTPADEDGDRGCVTSDFARDESGKVTRTSVCEGGMTGQGEITREGDDSYSGEILYSSSDGSVVIQLSGTRIGECDNPQ